MKNVYLILLLIFLSQNGWTQFEVNLLSNWDYKRKETIYEKINHVISTTNGFVIAVGETIGEDYNGTDGLFMVLDGETGQSEVWKKVGMTGFQSFNKVIQNFDGTFFVIGYTSTSEKEPRQGWVVQIDAFGEEIDHFLLPPDKKNSTELTSIAMNSNGEFMAIGNRSDGTNNQPFAVTFSDMLDYQMIDINMKGISEVVDIASNGDDRFAIVGNYSNSHQIGISEFSSQGQMTWDEVVTFGEKGTNLCQSICRSTLFGGYIISGITTEKGQGETDMWIVKIDDDGLLEWESTFGGSSQDQAHQAVELSDGKIAVIGETKSHIDRAKNSSIQLVIFSEDGQNLDSDYYPIVGGNGNEIGYSVASLVSGPTAIFAGNTVPQKRESSITVVSAVDYSTPTMLATREEFQEIYGTSSNTSLNLSTVQLVDQNGNRYIEENERAYLQVDVENQTEEFIHEIEARVSSSERNDLLFWNTIYVGSIPPGQSRQLRIPVQASENLRKNNYDFSVSVVAGELPLGMSSATISSNSPDPANLIVNRFSFSPEFGAEPGKDVFLTIDFENIGGQPTNEMSADFVIPSGVISNQSERISIPSLAPDESHTHTFSFQFQEEFQENIITLQLESQQTDFKKTFNYDIDPVSSAVVSDASATRGASSMILWTSHDVDDLRSIDVNQKEVQIKAITVSNVELSKNNFAVLINGKRVQGQKLDETQLTPRRIPVIIFNRLMPIKSFWMKEKMK